MVQHQPHRTSNRGITPGASGPGNNKKEKGVPAGQRSNVQQNKEKQANQKSVNGR